MNNYIEVGASEFIELTPEQCAADPAFCALAKRKKEAELPSRAELLKNTGFSASECLANPAACFAAKAEAIRLANLRKSKNKNLLLWGGAAAVVGFLLLRKK